MPRKPHKNNTACQPERKYTPTSKRAPVHGSSAAAAAPRKEGTDAVLMPFSLPPTTPANLLLFLNSLHVFLLQRPSTPPLAGGDVGLPSTQGGVSRQTHATQVFRPVEQKTRMNGHAETHFSTHTGTVTLPLWEEVIMVTETSFKWMLLVFVCVFLFCF